MKEYKIIEVNKKSAEQLMNDMAKQGWEVVNSIWSMWNICLLITFVREK